MTDGPFRNKDLPARWKRYGAVIVSATSLEECTAHACHAMMGDMNMKQVSSLMGDLEDYSQRSQIDLMPAESIGGIFEKHPNSVFLNTYKKHLIANVRDNMPFLKASSEALSSTFNDLRSIAKNRVDEQALLARERREITQAVYNKVIERNHETFSALDQNAFCNALKAGDKNAFKSATQKIYSVDEGPVG